MASEPEDATSANQAFRPEAGFTDHRNLLGQLSREERAQLLELVELDLRAEYEQRLQEELDRQQRDQATALGSLSAATAAFHASLAGELGGAIDQALRETADAAARLAVVIAEKLVRERVTVDRNVLVRAIETILFKAEPGVNLRVTCHPDDAAVLGEAPELRARLRIAEVKEDRRIARGGCLVRAGDLEWDATLQRQLAVLEEIARAALAGTGVAAEGPADGDVRLE